MPKTPLAVWLAAAALLCARPAAAGPDEATSPAYRAARLDPVRRLIRVWKINGRRLGLGQAVAVLRAHRVGRNEIGADKKRPAGVNPDGSSNLQFKHVIRKYRILHRAGFDRSTISQLMDAGLVGTPTTGEQVRERRAELARMASQNPPGKPAASALAKPDKERTQQDWEAIYRDEGGTMAANLAVLSKYMR